MKRYILSSVFVLLMIFSLPSPAHAEEFCALGSHSAGTELNCYIAKVSNEAVVSAEGLYDGLYLSENPTKDGKHLSLRGKAMNAGQLSFSVTVSEAPELISCSAEILAARPVVALSGDMRCAVGENVSIELSASAADNGTLSIQWFSGETASPAGAIVGATGYSYSPDTSVPGRYAFCCEVTNTNNTSSSSVVSPPVYVTVAEPVLTGIEINTLPDKLSYTPGDSLDPSGLSLLLNFDTGTPQVIQGGFEASPAVFTELGKQQVELRYGGFSCFYDVEVKLSQADIEGIGVLTLPQKTEYKAGDTLDITGLSIRAYTKNGHFDVSEGLKCSPEKLRESGRQSITVEYMGKRCSFTVTVKDDNQLKSIDIASLPTRREYSVGDRLDTAGLSIQLIYGSKTEITSSGFSCTPDVLSHAGAQTVTVSYAGHTASFSINVKEAPSVSATPAPSQTPAAEAAPSKSDAPAKVPGPGYEHQARELGGLVKIIFAAAVLSLAGLLAYVLYMRKIGKR